ncbi:BQ2448_4582 [Microbotryum intermedium]|uniref:non-specific serine/threonine protein kinase n=1 Tax=Microbotryum intermedium TaxID=269621 RepID=A0A238FL26_9BASI|nr:BQ2448_4582 [Microbotryum intermedium]
MAADGLRANPPSATSSPSSPPPLASPLPSYDATTSKSTPPPATKHSTRWISRSSTYLKLVLALLLVYHLHLPSFTLPTSLPRIEAIAYPPQLGHDIVYGLRVVIPTTSQGKPDQLLLEIGKIPDDQLKGRVLDSFVGLSDSWFFFKIQSKEDTHYLLATLFMANLVTRQEANQILRKGPVSRSSERTNSTSLLPIAIHRIPSLMTLSAAYMAGAEVGTRVLFRTIRLNPDDKITPVVVGAGSVLGCVVLFSKSSSAEEGGVAVRKMNAEHVRMFGLGSGVRVGTLMNAQEGGRGNEVGMIRVLSDEERISKCFLKPFVHFKTLTPTSALLDHPFFAGPAQESAFVTSQAFERSPSDEGDWLDAAVARLKAFIGQGLLQTSEMGEPNHRRLRRVPVPSPLPPLVHVAPHIEPDKLGTLDLNIARETSGASSLNTQLQRILTKNELRRTPMMATVNVVGPKVTSPGPKPSPAAVDRSGARAFKAVEDITDPNGRTSSPRLLNYCLHKPKITSRPLPHLPTLHNAVSPSSTRYPTPCTSRPTMSTRPPLPCPPPRPYDTPGSPRPITALESVYGISTLVSPRLRPNDSVDWFSSGAIDKEVGSTFFFGQRQAQSSTSMAHRALPNLPRTQRRNEPRLPSIPTVKGYPLALPPSPRPPSMMQTRPDITATTNARAPPQSKNEASAHPPESCESPLSMKRTSNIPLASSSSILVHSGFWDLLAATGSRLYNPLSRIVGPGLTVAPSAFAAGGDELWDQGGYKRIDYHAPLPPEMQGGPNGGGLRKVKGVHKGLIGRPEGFTHLVHASDAEQAEVLLRRWKQEGVGKIGQPGWAEPIKAATRTIARARGIAEVQAARNDAQQEARLQVINGLPSSVISPCNLSPSPLGTSSIPSERGAIEDDLFLGLLEVQNSPFLKGGVGQPDEHDRTLTPQRGPAAGLGTTRFSPGGRPILPEFGTSSPSSRQEVYFDHSSSNEDDSSNDDTIIHDPEALHTLLAEPKFVPSLLTIEKAVAAKIYFETKYHAIFKQPRDRDTRRLLLEQELMRLTLNDQQRRCVREAWKLSETEYLREMRQRVGVNSFVKLKTIGHGAFGVVSLVKEKGTGEVFAMKQLRKTDMLRKGQEGHVRAERDLLATASTSTRWTVRLAYSFQDVDHLYLVMTYMGGGDLLTLLIERDTFKESFAKFYIAEMICAIQETHTVLGAIHRDVKPDNFLFDSNGHIAISDFGLATDFHWAHDGAYFEQQRRELLYKHGIDLDDGTKGGRKLPRGEPIFDPKRNSEQPSGGEDGGAGSLLTWRDRNRRRLAYSVVGTNNYMSVEVLRGHGYGAESDWWSLGVIMFEMLYGYPPFVSKNRTQTRQKKPPSASSQIQNWRTYLRFPSTPRISREAQDLITRLICEREDRLGSRMTSSKDRPNSMLESLRSPAGPLRGPGVVGASTTLGGTMGMRSGGGQGADGAEEIKAHPWFRGIDFASLHLQTPPFVPSLTCPTDTRYFEDDIDANPLPAPEIAPGVPAPDTTRDPLLRHVEHGEMLLDARKGLAFQGWTYKKPKRTIYDPRKGLDLSSTASWSRGEVGNGEVFPMIYRGRSTLRVQGGSGLRSLSV